MKKLLPFLIFLLSAGSLTAGVYHVDKNSLNASDLNSGTAEMPLKTIQEGINRAAAGDTVLVHYAVYEENIVMQRSGNSKAYITIMAAAAGELPVIEGIDILKDKLVNWGSDNKDYIIFDGFEVRNANKWGIWVEGNNNIIRNCKVHATLRSGISIVTGDNNLISRNEVYNIGNLLLKQIGNSIHVESRPNEGLTANNNIIEYNNIYDNDTHFGVNLFPEAVTGYPQLPMHGNIIRNNKIDRCLGGIYTRYQVGLEIYNNIISNSIDNGIWFHFQSSAPADINTFNADSKIYSNTIFGSENRGLFNSTSNGLDIRNNLFIDNGNTAEGGQEHIRMDKTEGHIIDNNLYFGIGKWRWLDKIYNTFDDWKIGAGMDLSSLTADPLLFNTGVLIFDITSVSPAVDKGAYLGAPYDYDFYGTPRPAGEGYDIGAVEYKELLNNNSGTELKLKVFLQGPYFNGEMTNHLSRNGYLPNAQPYNKAPWFYEGNETVSAVQDDVVDWILVELRDSLDESTIKTAKASLLKTDGTITGADGKPIVFNNLNAGQYYICIKHRNHLSVISSAAVIFNSAAEYDFTDSAQKAYGNRPMINLGNDKYGMYSGDYSADGFIDSDDFIGPDNDLFMDNYRSSDLNLDGFVDSDDFINPDNNLFSGSNVEN